MSMKLKFEIALGIIKDARSGCVCRMFRECYPDRYITFVDGRLIEYIGKEKTEYNASQHDMLADDWLVKEETCVPVFTVPYMFLEDEKQMESTIVDYRLRYDFILNPESLLC